MKTYAVDFAYYEWDQLIYTIKWIQCSSSEKAVDILEKQHGNIHIQDVRKMRDYFI